MGECNAAQALGDDPGAVLLADVVQFAARVRPAACQGQRRAAHAPGFGKGVISGMAVRRANSPPDCLLILLTLQDALEASQDIHRMAAAAPHCLTGECRHSPRRGRIGEHNRRGIVAIPAVRHRARTNGATMAHHHGPAPKGSRSWFCPPRDQALGRGSHLLPGRRMQGMLPRGHEQPGGPLEVDQHTVHDWGQMVGRDAATHVARVERSRLTPPRAYIRHWRYSGR